MKPTVFHTQGLWVMAKWLKKQQNMKTSINICIETEHKRKFPVYTSYVNNHQALQTVERFQLGENIDQLITCTYIQDHPLEIVLIIVRSQLYFAITITILYQFVSVAPSKSSPCTFHSLLLQSHTDFDCNFVRAL